MSNVDAVNEKVSSNAVIEQDKGLMLEQINTSLDKTELQNDFAQIIESNIIDKDLMESPLLKPELSPIIEQQDLVTISPASQKKEEILDAKNAKEAALQNLQKSNVKINKKTISKYFKYLNFSPNDLSKSNVSVESTKVQPQQFMNLNDKQINNLFKKLAVMHNKINKVLNSRDVSFEAVQEITSNDDLVLKDPDTKELEFEPE